MAEVILTVAHLDHDPRNNDPKNLKAMCQRCHLRYDKDLHLKTIRERVGKGVTSNSLTNLKAEIPKTGKDWIKRPKSKYLEIMKKARAARKG